VQTGGHTYWCCREASGPDEMRRAVRDQVRGGADLIKIMACHDRLEFTDEELDAVVDETHRNGLTITAHATYDACIARVMRHGVDMIEHGGSMSDETIQLLLERGAYICTTFSPVVLQAEMARVGLSAMSGLRSCTSLGTPHSSHSRPAARPAENVVQM